MAVKCLDKHEKRYVLFYYSKKVHTITELAGLFHVSRRTIKRVIDEASDE